MNKEDNEVTYRELNSRYGWELVPTKYKDNYHGRNYLHIKIHNSKYKKFMIEEFNMQMRKKRRKSSFSLMAFTEYCYYFDKEKDAKAAAAWYNTIDVLERLLGDDNK